MSAKATFWAWEQKIGHTTKIVLLALANFANDDGESWHSYESISKACGLSRRSVIEQCKKLVNEGLLTIKERKKDERMNYSNVFKLHVFASAGVVNHLHQGGEPPSLGSESPAPKSKRESERSNTPTVPKGDKEREELFWLIAALWNKGFKSFTQIRDYNNTRKKNLKRIVKNYPNFKDIEKWKDLFRRMKKSEWIMSRDGRNNGFKINIDWVMKDEYFTKIVEGNYN